MIGLAGFSQRQTRDDQSRSASKDTLVRVVVLRVWRYMVARLVSDTGACWSDRSKRFDGSPKGTRKAGNGTWMNQE